MSSEGKIVVAWLGVEGGGAKIYAREVEGVWSFWQAGTSIDFDENDDEVWRDWTLEPVAELALALPEIWSTMHPIEIHPDFVAWFRDAYERRAVSPFDRHAAAHWARILTTASARCART